MFRVRSDCHEYPLHGCLWNHLAKHGRCGCRLGIGRSTGVPGSGIASDRTTDARGTAGQRNGVTRGGYRRRHPHSRSGGIMHGRTASEEWVGCCYRPDGQGLNALATPARRRAEAPCLRPIEHLWLCGSCAPGLTLVSDHGVAVRMQPQRRPAVSSSVSGDKVQLRQSTP